jgi:rhodanese-related sulfurtransferase
MTGRRHDDAIMALCLALYARDETMRGVPIGSESSNMLKILKSNSFEEIKNEILEGGIEDWAMDYESESIKEFTIDQYDMIETKRQNDKILKEFNW